MTDEIRVSERFSVQATPVQRERWNQAAKLRGLRFLDWVRDALDMVADLQRDEALESAKRMVEKRKQGALSLMELERRGRWSELPAGYVLTIPAKELPEELQHPMMTAEYLSASEPLEAVFQSEAHRECEEAHMTPLCTTPDREDRLAEQWRHGGFDAVPVVVQRWYRIFWQRQENMLLARERGVIPRCKGHMVSI